jgi:hypothetical protein
VLTTIAPTKLRSRPITLEAKSRTRSKVHASLPSHHYSGMAVVGSGPKGDDSSEDNEGQWNRLMKSIFSQASSNLPADPTEPSSSFSGEGKFRRKYCFRLTF